jgi:hypothetical protein
MAPSMSTAARRGPRLLALGGLAVALRHWGSQGPAYAVKGSWQGEPSVLTSAAKGELGTLVEGLEPHVKFPNIKYSREGVALSVEDGQLFADYTTALDGDTQLNLRVNDAQAWVASLVGGDASLKVRGQGRDLDSLSWEAAQESSVEGVGDVKLEFNSDKAYNLTVSRAGLAEIAGASIDAKIKATNAGLTGRFSTHRELPGGAELSYSVENPVGVYDVGSAKHNAKLSATVAGGAAALEAEHGGAGDVYKASYKASVGGGEADLRVSQNAGALGYNVTYTRSLSDLVPVAADAQVGVDEDGAYGRLSASRDLGNGLEAYYEALARLGQGEGSQERLQHALKVSNQLGYAQLTQGKGEDLRLRMGYEFNA